MKYLSKKPIFFDLGERTPEEKEMRELWDMCFPSEEPAKPSYWTTCPESLKPKEEKE